MKKIALMLTLGMTLHAFADEAIVGRIINRNNENQQIVSSCAARSAGGECTGYKLTVVGVTDVTTLYGGKTINQDSLPKNLRRKFETLIEFEKQNPSLDKNGDYVVNDTLVDLITSVRAARLVHRLLGHYGDSKVSELTFVELLNATDAN